MKGFVPLLIGARVIDASIIQILRYHRILNERINKERV